MQRHNPATTRKALAFAHELAKLGIAFVVIPVTTDRQADHLANLLTDALRLMDESAGVDTSKRE